MAKKKRSKKSASSPSKAAQEMAILCSDLEGIFRELEIIQDVMIVCSEASSSHAQGELHKEMRTVLRVHVCNPFFGQLKELHRVILKMGGTTSMGDDIDKEE
jgi:hypothetical protein